MLTYKLLLERTVSSNNYETFADFDIRKGDINSIGGGVLGEIATAFDYDLSSQPTVDELGGLISVVGPAEELRNNIGLVQDRIGSGLGAVALARSWVERTGLLVPVDREYYSGETQVPDHFDLAVVSGGVRNWMERRANVLQRQLDAGKHIGSIILVGGNRKMKTVEGPGVEEGMTEGDYLQSVIMPRFDGNEVQVFKPNTANGDQVMAHIAGTVAEARSVLLAANAGNWLQNGGQLIRSIDQNSADTERKRRLHVVSDEFELGTGTEPAATHQNPFTALGQIVRNYQEIVRHQTM